MNGITGEPGIWPEQLLLTTRRRRPAEAPGLPNRVGRRSHQTGVWGVIGRARPVGVAGAVETRERVNEPPAGPVRERGAAQLGTNAAARACVSVTPAARGWAVQPRARSFPPTRRRGVCRRCWLPCSSNAVILMPPAAGSRGRSFDVHRRCVGDSEEIACSRFAPHPASRLAQITVTALSRTAAGRASASPRATSRRTYSQAWNPTGFFFIAPEAGTGPGQLGPTYGAYPSRVCSRWVGSRPGALHRSASFLRFRSASCAGRSRSNRARTCACARSVMFRPTAVCSRAAARALIRRDDDFWRLLSLMKCVCSTPGRPPIDRGVRSRVAVPRRQVTSQGLTSARVCRLPISWIASKHLTKKHARYLRPIDPRCVVTRLRIY